MKHIKIQIVLNHIEEKCFLDHFNAKSGPFALLEQLGSPQSAA